MADEVRSGIRADAESVRKRLSAGEHAVCTFIYAGDRISLDITRAEFEDAARHLTEQLFAVVDSTLEKAGLTEGDIDAVLLAGGGVKMPMLRSAFEARFADKVTFWEPEFSVAKGAAVYGNMLKYRRIENGCSCCGPDGIII